MDNTVPKVSTTLILPVFEAYAGFYAGDGHRVPG
jgi:acetamidase/formamidase